ncbi:MAG TPA: SDR family oxidoreductase [Blastocatellia bacterium]|nr:SDR family oxidoreductase [Blastocatellia bacterium]
MTDQNINMTGKVALVTGANSGIGKETALALARMKANLVIVCRDNDRGRAALEEIKSKSDNPSVELMICDLSSQTQIRKLAEEFKQKHDRLDVLVNNAGVILTRRRVTEDGLEATFAINHLAYFLLTNLLLDLINKSAPARIVNVSSTVHKSATIDFNDLQSERSYSSMRAYGQSKLANVLFTYELARRLEGTGVTVNCLHPGVIATNIFRDISGVVGAAAKLFLKSPRRGAETSIYLASSPEVEGITGKYFDDRRAVRSSPESYDEAIAGRLWQVSERLTNLQA